MMDVTRRRFLVLAGGVAGVVLPARAPRADAGGTLDQAAHRARSARAVGLAYLEATPAERSAEVLVAELASQLPGGRAAVASCPDARLRQQLQAAITDDFAHERIVVLRGWVLSRSEARLCALTALAFDT